jgi:hypothetical protein
MDFKISSVRLLQYFVIQIKRSNYIFIYFIFVDFEGFSPIEFVILNDGSEFPQNRINRKSN